LRALAEPQSGVWIKCKYSKYLFLFYFIKKRQQNDVQTYTENVVTPMRDWKNAGKQIYAVLS